MEASDRERASLFWLLGRDYFFDVEVAHLRSNIHLRQLTVFEHLSDLDLHDTSIRDDDLRILSLLPELHSVNLSGTKVTDAGMREIASNANIHFLSIRDTRVTEEGLRHLLALTELKVLYVGRQFKSTPIVEELKKRFPKLVVACLDLYSSQGC
jgi:hypothetical protein